MSNKPTGSVVSGLDDSSGFPLPSMSSTFLFFGFFNFGEGCERMTLAVARENRNEPIGLSWAGTASAGVVGRSDGNNIDDAVCEAIILGADETG